MSKRSSTRGEVCSDRSKEALFLLHLPQVRNRTVAYPVRGDVGLLIQELKVRRQPTDGEDMVADSLIFSALAHVKAGVVVRQLRIVDVPRLLPQLVPSQARDVSSDAKHPHQLNRVRFGRLLLAKMFWTAPVNHSSATLPPEGAPGSAVRSIHDAREIG